jgi:hypothetical protein
MVIVGGAFACHIRSMIKQDAPHPETLAAQAMGFVDAETKAVVPPLHTATTYIRDPDNQFRSGRVYARDDNPRSITPRICWRRSKADRKRCFSRPAWRRPRRSSRRWRRAIMWWRRA